MSQVSGQGTIWNLPNYAGELFTADAENTPFLSMIGGMNGGVQVNSFSFPCGSTYDYPTAAQPAITETASLTKPTAIEFVRAQVFNVCQIFHEQVSISYEKLANQGYMSGLNTANQINSVADEKAWQISRTLIHIARDIEYTFLQGSYQIATDAGVANKTCGVLSAISTATVAAGGAKLSKTFMDALLKEMYDGGAAFTRPVIFVNSFQKQKISDAYGYAPTDRNVGGLNIKQIEPDFGPIGIVLDRFMPAAQLLVADLAVCRPVFQPVPGKGNFFYEELSKGGASEDGQIFGKAGLDYGVEYMHGSITDLATS
jgi:hypothetical protein